MATVIPAIKAQMGSTTYYETTMTAQELAGTARAASSMDEWASTSIEERIQRELNEKRVKDEIVPYLVQAEDRFFSAVIVLIMDGKLEFEDVTQFGLKVPAAQREAAEKMGFLNISGGRRIVLDGQHRLTALRHVTNGNYDEENATFAADVPNDEICVIFMEYEGPEKTRRIFNKVNRTARTTTRADNIITSEDDGPAIITRRLIADGGPLNFTYGPKNELIVEWKSNTIAKRGTKLTTMSAVYESIKDILKAEEIEMPDEKKSIVRPSDEDLEEAYEAAERWWSKLIAGISTFKAVTDDPSLLPKMREAGTDKLLLQPNGQQALIKGLAQAVEAGANLDVAIDRADKIDWADMALWESILIKPNGGMIARAENYRLAADLIAYLVGSEQTQPKQVESLNHEIAKIKGEIKPDAPIGSAPEMLPDPIA